jgi:hypothetical protein
MYAPGAEIQRYLQNTAERFGATRFIKTQHRVDRCEYLAEEKKWYGLPCYDIQGGMWTDLDIGKSQSQTWQRARPLRTRLMCSSRLVVS